MSQYCINFNPRSPQGERLHARGFDTDIMQFQSTLPAGGATGDIKMYYTRHKDFNPRSPQGERPTPHDDNAGSIGYFNPRSPQGERLFNIGCTTKNGVISIHAPRRGSDEGGKMDVRTQKHFNPRSPQGERLLTGRKRSRESLFQSTLPAGGAT